MKKYVGALLCVGLLIVLGLGYTGGGVAEEDLSDGALGDLFGGQTQQRWCNAAMSGCTGVEQLCAWGGCMNPNEYCGNTTLFYYPEVCDPVFGNEYCSSTTKMVICFVSRPCKCFLTAEELMCATNWDPDPTIVKAQTSTLCSGEEEI